MRNSRPSRSCTYAHFARRAAVLIIANSMVGHPLSYGGREGPSRHVAATSGRCRVDGAAMAAFPTCRSDVGPMSGRWRCDGAATSGRCRADGAATSLQCRCDGAATSLRCRRDVAATSLRCRRDGASTSLRCRCDVAICRDAVLDTLLRMRVLLLENADRPRSCSVSRAGS